MTLPKKHHYIPAFYLKRWANTNDCLVEFSRPYRGIVKPLRRHPDATGYVDRLYEMRGVQAAQAQDLERLFMSPVDSRASEALEILERTDSTRSWNSGTRSAWSRFILSLLMRTPDDIEQLRRNISAEWTITTAAEEDQYAQARGPEFPFRFAEYLRDVEHIEIDKAVSRVSRSLIDHAKIGEIINNMRWLILETSNVDVELLTSDRPILISATLREHDAYIIMPVGPHKIFAAVHNEATAKRLVDQSIRALVKSVNKLVVSHAVNYVYGRDDSQLRFIQKHMASRPQVSLLERLGRARANAKST